MEPPRAEESSIFHVVAVPYPGRGHVNPMMNFCKLLCSKHPDILITLVVTEEWFGFIGSDNKPANVRFRTIPNVIPSELVRAKDFSGFVAAVLTKMEAPFEELLDRLELPVTAIIADTYVPWTVEAGRRRNIPVASFWTMSASVLSVFHHLNLLEEHQHFPADLSERGNELVDYIPGLAPIRLADLPTIFHGTGRQVLQFALDCISLVPKSQFLLFTSVYELENQVIDAFKAKLPFPVYAIGPSIPYLDLKQKSSTASNIDAPEYFSWLDSQPQHSVLYISLGSFLSISAAQMDEIVAGVQNSGVRYLWVSRGDSSRFKDSCSGGRGVVIPWSDQLRVLSHSCVGGFWTHCGWNSTLEALYSGVRMLTFPIFWDQVPNSKAIVEDWKTGWRVKKDKVGESLMMRDEIAELVRKFMDSESNEGKEMRRRAGKLKEACQLAIEKGGSSDTNVDSFIKDILGRHS